jgi:hypothetical protein
VFSVIQSIIGNNNSFHLPVVLHQTLDDEISRRVLKMSKSPSFLQKEKSFIKSASPDPVLRNYLSTSALYGKDKIEHSNSILKLAASHA